MNSLIIFCLFLSSPETPGQMFRDYFHIQVDTDGDGIPDDADQCPTLPGPATHNGCPVIPPYIEHLFGRDHSPVSFHSGSSVLMDHCFPMLDSMATVLLIHPEYKLNISGHTDNIGSRSQNILLSQQRADAVKTYLVKRGVEPNRVISTGIGPDKPIADNGTAQGRQVNRRVEFDLYY